MLPYMPDYGSLGGGIFEFNQEWIMYNLSKIDLCLNQNSKECFTSSNIDVFFTGNKIDVCQESNNIRKLHYIENEGMTIQIVLKV